MARLRLLTEAPPLLGVAEPEREPPRPVEKEVVRLEKVIRLLENDELIS